MIYYFFKKISNKDLRIYLKKQDCKFKENHHAFNLNDKIFFKKLVFLLDIITFF